MQKVMKVYKVEPAGARSTSESAALREHRENEVRPHQGHKELFLFRAVVTSRELWRM